MAKETRTERYRRLDQEHHAAEAARKAEKAARKYEYQRRLELLATCCECGGVGYVRNPDDEEAAMTGIERMSCYHCYEEGKTSRKCCTG